MPFVEGHDSEGNPTSTEFDEATGAPGTVTERPATGGIPSAVNTDVGFAPGYGLVSNGPTVEEMRTYSREHLEEMGNKESKRVSDPLGAAADAIKESARAQADAIIANADKAAEAIMATTEAQGEDNLAALYAYRESQSANIHGESTDPAILANAVMGGLADPDANLHLQHTEEDEKWANEGISTESPVRTEAEMADGGDNTPPVEDHTDVQKVALVDDDVEDDSIHTAPATAVKDGENGSWVDPNNADVAPVVEDDA